MGFLVRSCFLPRRRLASRPSPFRTCGEARHDGGRPDLPHRHGVFRRNQLPGSDSLSLQGFLPILLIPYTKPTKWQANVGSGQVKLQRQDSFPNSSSCGHNLPQLRCSAATDYPDETVASAAELRLLLVCVPTSCSVFSLAGSSGSEVGRDSFQVPPSGQGSVYNYRIIRVPV